MIWLAAGLLILTALAGIEGLLGGYRLGRLGEFPPVDRHRAPMVSIVIAARDEGAHIEAALATLLGQDYPDYEVIVVDDRSSDDTGSILDRMAAQDRRIAVMHVRELPPGWLGKNHALHVGAARARGRYVLFTDADVHLAPDVLSRAVGRMEATGIDHLAAGPDLIMPGLLMQAFGAFFISAFLAFAKPWKASDPKSWFFVGVGAFNLVRRSAYEAIGGHERVRLRPDDDLKLGKVLKRAGYRQEAANGAGVMSVAWYHSLPEMIGGLEKNMFAGVEYSVALSLLGGAVQLLLGVAPVVALGLVTGPAQILFGLQVLVGVTILGLHARASRIPVRAALLLPVVTALFVFILWRTMILNLWQGGIRWRGTFYALSELKANRV